MKIPRILMLGAAPLMFAGCTIESGFGGGTRDTSPALVEVPAALPASPAEAAPVPPAPGLWRARGNEPGWMLTMDGETMTLTTNYGEQTYSAPEPAPTTLDEGMKWTDAEGALVVTALSKICADDMTGMPYPATVTVEFGEQVLRGCGGEPESLLTGEEWIVEDINNAGIIDGARVTITFDVNAGRIGGSGGCNRYGAPFTLSGEGLSFGPAMRTEMACAPSLMKLEDAFHETLASVYYFAIDETGALILLGPDGKRILARR